MSSISMGTRQLSPAPHHHTGMQSQVPAPGLFQMLPERRPPWKEFGLSMAVETVALILLAWVAVLHPEVIAPRKDYHYVRLVDTPIPVNHEPAPIRVIQPPVVAQKTPVLRVPKETPPVAKAQPEETYVPPRVEVATVKPMPVPAPAPVIPRQLVKTNVFSTGSSANPTIALAPQKVQTGGFGDPNGVPARETNGRPVNIAQLGSFDLPTGGGYGNGTGGAKGARGVVASSGFGNGVATGDGSGRANISRGTVQQGGFGDVSQVATTAGHSKPAEITPKVVPAEITSKPTPSYTEEARKMRIEGEVLLEVVLEASGSIRVVRVVRSLGHGLDESAVRAVEQIRFKPALRDGQPADSSAVLHILFQLT